MLSALQGRSELQKRWKRCHGHGPLEDSDLSDNPHKPHLPFSGDFNAVHHPAHGKTTSISSKDHSFMKLNRGKIR